jgi:hypothetical protein
MSIERFRNVALSFLGDGQELTSAEVRLVFDEIDQYFEDYKTAMGEYPGSDLSTFYYFAWRLEKYGFTMPDLDRSVEEDMVTIREYAKRKGIAKS